MLSLCDRIAINGICLHLDDNTFTDSRERSLVVEGWDTLCLFTRTRGEVNSSIGATGGISQGAYIPVKWIALILLIVFLGICCLRRGQDYLEEYVSPSLS